MYAAIGLAVVAMIWKGADFVSDKYALEREVATLSFIIDSKDNEIATLKLIKIAAEHAARIAEEERQAAETRAQQLRRIRDAALNSGEENDGPIAPVLRDTLDSINARRNERLREESGEGSSSSD